MNQSMTESATSDAPNVSAGPGKGLNIALWCVQVLLALAFLGASSGKLMGRPEMVALFEAVGIGQWFRYVTGILELAGAALIVVPKTRGVGAGLLAAIMLCAIAIHLFILHSAPTAPLVLLLLAASISLGTAKRTSRRTADTTRPFMPIRWRTNAGGNRRSVVRSLAASSERT